MSIVVHVTSTEKVLRGAVRLSAAMVIPWQAEKLPSDRAGASASRPRKLFLDDGLESIFSPIYNIHQPDVVCFVSRGASLHSQTFLSAIFLVRYTNCDV